MGVQSSNDMYLNAEAAKPIRVLHCVRSPVGGILRHIKDLVHYQVSLGYEVGLVCDALTCGELEDAKLQALAPLLRLGIAKFAMPRSLGLGDVKIYGDIYRHVQSLHIDVMHSHGAKGGAFGRLVAGHLNLKRPFDGKIVTLYSPHGGSLHFAPDSLQGKVYFALERFLERMTDEFLFVCDYERNCYAEKVGRPSIPWGVAYNGLTEPELMPVTLSEEARSFAYIGNMRALKGTDVFIDAVEALYQNGADGLKVFMIGEGEAKDAYEADAIERGLGNVIEFRDSMPIRDAFALAETVVVPSRAESMPYLVLESIGAGRPILTTDVGGVHEIYGRYKDTLLPPGDVEALTRAMGAHLHNPAPLQEIAQGLHERVSSEFSTQMLCRRVNATYHRHMTPRLVERPELELVMG